jgi:RND family efflux transporter MFP subunit
MENEMFRPKYIVLAIVIALALVGCQAQATPTPPQTATIQRGNLTATLSAAGTVSARSQVTLMFQTSGQVKSINVKVGDQVKAGQVLAQLAAPDLEISLAKAQNALQTSQIKLQQTQAGPKAADIESARAALASAQAAYQVALDKYKLTNAQLAVARTQVDKAAATIQRDQAAYDWEKNNWLDPNPSLSAQATALSDAQTAYTMTLEAYNQQAAGINNTALESAASQVAQAQYQLDNLLNTPTPEALSQAQAQVKQDEASVQQAQVQLAQASVVAPFDGIVADIYAQPGQSVGSSTQALALADLSHLNIAITLSEVDIPQVQPGQPVHVTLDADPGTVFTGTVTEVDLVGVATQGVVNYGAMVTLADSTSTIRPGMNASANIILQHRENVLLVPNRAVRTVGNRKLVTVLYKGQLIDVPVTLGLSGDTSSEVLSGLQEGDVVVIGPTTTTTLRGVPGGGILRGFGG